MVRWERWKPTPEAQVVLHEAYAHAPHPDKVTTRRLATALHTTTRRVKVWFQNKRQRLLTPVEAHAYVLRARYGYDEAEARAHAETEFLLLLYEEERLDDGAGDHEEEPSTGCAA
jgi:hypothetical protein